MGNNEQEIDLVELLIKIYKFIIKRKWLLLSSCIIGLTLGAISITRNPSKYKAFYKKNYISLSSSVSKETLAELINGLHENFPPNPSINDLNHLSSLLNLPIDITKTFKNISITTDYTNEKYNGGVKFTIEVFDKEKFDTITNSIIYYIDSNPYVKERYELLIKQQSELLSLINKKIKELDSCNINCYKHQTIPSSNASITFNENLKEFNYVQLYQQKQLIEKELQLDKTNLYFISTNSPIAFVSNKPIIIVTIAGYGLLGIIIGVIIGIIPKVRKSLKENLAKKN